MSWHSVLITRRRATCMWVVHTSSFMVPCQDPWRGIYTVDPARLHLCVWSRVNFSKAGIFAVSVEMSTFAMRPTQVMGIQPLNDSHTCMFALVTPRQHVRNHRDHRKANHPTDHRLSHDSLLAECSHDCILGLLGEGFPSSALRRADEPPPHARSWGRSLQCSSQFSFLQGASYAEEYVARAAQLGYSAIAITDECSLAGVVRAHVEATAAGLPLIIGSHFRLTAADGTATLAFTALAMNRDGCGNLCELVSLGRMRGKKGSYRLAPLDLEHLEPPYTHLRGLADCLAILSPDFPANEQRLDAQIAWFARVFADCA